MCSPSPRQNANSGTAAATLRINNGSRVDLTTSAQVLEAIRDERRMSTGPAVRQMQVVSSLAVSQIQPLISKQIRRHVSQKSLNSQHFSTSDSEKQLPLGTEVEYTVNN